MKKVKIYGAGSIGNHLAQASRRMGWSVDICDIDDEALNRTKNEIYPSRYGNWDNQINLYNNQKAPVGVYDLIIIGTPPDSHMKLARSAVKEGAKAVLVEKPLCSPDLSGAKELFEDAVTLCHTHHLRLHSIYGKKPKFITANKQPRWVEKQREKTWLGTMA